MYVVMFIMLYKGVLQCGTVYFALQGGSLQSVYVKA